MSGMLKGAILKCPVCLAHRPAQAPEPLLPHEIPTRPWEKVGADLFEFSGSTYLLLVDYYTNFVEVELVTRFTASHVIAALTSQFARYGLPGCLVSDNGPPFNSDAFRTFMTELDIQHVTSSPRYPQSNGKAENSVQTVKNLMRNAKEDGKNPQWALMMWRNTPSEGLNVSPAQRLFGRACRTLLPSLRSSLLPRHPTSVPEAIARQKARQASYYDRRTRSLPPLALGQTIRMRLPGQDTWTPGVCVKPAGPRSYWVRVDGMLYRRNRRQLLSTSEPPPPHPVTESFAQPAQADPVPSIPVREEGQRLGTPRRLGQGSPGPPFILPAATQSPDELSPGSADPLSPEPISPDNPALPRRSGRISRPPPYLADYVPR